MNPTIIALCAEGFVALFIFLGMTAIATGLI